MKNYLKLSLVALVLLITNVSVFAQNETTIWVKVLDVIPENVDTNTIYSYIQLSDNQGNVSLNTQASIQAFTTEVSSNGRVKWKNAKGNGQNRIKFENILPKDNEERDFLQYQVEAENGFERVARVKTSIKPGEEEQYNIWISIRSGTGWIPLDFPIDPVMKLHP